MKKTIISIIGIALMLLAITACKPNYVIMPPIPGGNTSTVPSGTPVSNADDAIAALGKGEAVYLTQNTEFTAEQIALIPEDSVIDGNGKTITLPESTSSGKNTVALLLTKSVTIKNAIIDASQASSQSIGLMAATRAGETGDAFVIIITADNTTLENVQIITGNQFSGINVFEAKNVTLRDITIDTCLKAPINISSSIVTIDGLKANGSDWYGKNNVIQVNGMEGDSVKTASTVTFESTEGVDAVWVEAVAATYEAASEITDEKFQKDGQTKINGLNNWAVRYSDQPSKDVKGWMYYAPDQDASTFTLNADSKVAEQAEEDIKAMLTAIAGSDSDRKYSVIKLGQNIALDSQLDITIPVTIDGAEHTISRTEISGSDVGTKAAILITSSDVTLKNLSVSGPNTTTTDWDDGEYAIKAYGTTEAQLENVVLENVTIQNANAGMLVRGADVTLKGDIVLNNLEWGGIGVDCKSDDGNSIYACKLTVDSGCSVTGELSDNVPAIWTEHGTAIPPEGSEDVVVNGSGVDTTGTPYTEKDKNQYWYKLTPATI